MRLDRLLAAQALGSRSRVQSMIRRGRVAVNGGVVKDPGAETAPGRDVLTVDGAAVDSRIALHVLLNKPVGVLTAARDPKAATVMDGLPPRFISLGCMPVGRLDKDTTGLLLLTTDGELNHRLLSPRRHVDKVYLAWVDGPLTPADVQAFEAGLDLGDFTALPARLDILESGPHESRARVTVAEGKFHQVKRMFEARGRAVTRLHRAAFGPLVLEDDLPPGGWRELTESELAALYKAAGYKEKP